MLKKLVSEGELSEGSKSKKVEEQVLKGVYRKVGRDGRLSKEGG